VVQHASKSAQLSPWLCDAGLTLAFAWFLPRNLAAGPALAPLVAGLAALLGTALFLLPRALAAAAGLPRWRALSTLALTALAAATIALPAPFHWDWHTLPALLLIAPMVLALAAVADSMRLFVTGVTAAVGWTLFLLTLLCATPLWVLPVDRPEAPGPLVLNALVAINPLTHLAVMTGTDFLRQDFFYRHSALGSLRYAYPTPSAVVTGYLAVCFAWLGLRWAAGHSARS
jgi:hypothetical protein